MCFSSQVLVLPGCGGGSRLCLEELDLKQKGPSVIFNTSATSLSSGTMVTAQNSLRPLTHSNFIFLSSILLFPYFKANCVLTSIQKCVNMRQQATGYQIISDWWFYSTHICRSVVVTLCWWQSSRPGRIMKSISEGAAPCRPPAPAPDLTCHSFSIHSLWWHVLEKNVIIQYCHNVIEKKKNFRCIKEKS